MIHGSVSPFPPIDGPFALRISERRCLLSYSPPLCHQHLGARGAKWDSRSPKKLFANGHPAAFGNGGRPPTHCDFKCWKGFPLKGAEKRLTGPTSPLSGGRNPSFPHIAAPPIVLKRIKPQRPPPHSKPPRAIPPLQTARNPTPKRGISWFRGGGGAGPKAPPPFFPEPRCSKIHRHQKENPQHHPRKTKFRAIA